jgi:hypothetical protein
MRVARQVCRGTVAGQGKPVKTPPGEGSSWSATCRQGSSDQRDARHIAPAIRCTLPVATPRNSQSVALWQLLSSRCWPTLVRHRARQRENKVAGNDDKRPVSAPPPAYARHKVAMDFSTREARIRPMHLRRSAKAGRTSNQPTPSNSSARRRPGYGDGGDGGRRACVNFAPGKMDLPTLTSPARSNLRPTLVGPRTHSVAMSR